MPHIIIPDAILKSPHLAGLQLPIQGNTIKVPLDDQTVVNLVSVCRHVLLDPIDASDAVAVMRFDIQLKSNSELLARANCVINVLLAEFLTCSEYI